MELPISLHETVAFPAAEPKELERVIDRLRIEERIGVVVPRGNSRAERPERR